MALGESAYPCRPHIFPDPSLLAVVETTTKKVKRMKTVPPNGGLSKRTSSSEKGQVTTGQASIASLKEEVAKLEALHEKDLAIVDKMHNDHVRELSKFMGAIHLERIRKS
ncbi:hypothetical protein L1987_21342 [Smallanthus sonchifolius]|uniref:Uncharacterized protein n=1 Tax=Smallanthus sonchifolius TaxID=185202 RepID=A0ACB9IVU6_9ASTR|nr:hypothetical protein L1987_21342 [Smallanthus sonchifolius]